MWRHLEQTVKNEHVISDFAYTFFESSTECDVHQFWCFHDGSIRIGYDHFKTF